MRRTVRMSMIVSLCLFSLSCSVAKNKAFDNSRVQASETSKPNSTTAVQKSWEPLYFRVINERIEGTELRRLRDQEIPPDSREIRIWTGFDLSPLRGIILRQDDEGWSARYVKPLDKSSETQRTPALLPPPKSGWKILWGKLEGSGILTLPDAIDIGADNPSPDIGSVVVEIKTSDKYRTYKYEGLETSEHLEAQKLLKICRTLSDEFEIPLC
jgi:hypothetical protein